MSGSYDFPAQVDTWVALLQTNPVGATDLLGWCAGPKNACPGGHVGGALAGQGGQAEGIGHPHTQPAHPTAMATTCLHLSLGCTMMLAPSAAATLMLVATVHHIHCHHPPMPQVLEPRRIVLAATLVQPALRLLHLTRDLRSRGHEREQGISMAASTSAAALAAASCACPACTLLVPPPR